MFEVVIEVDGWLLSMIGCDGVVMVILMGLMVYLFLVGGLVVWLEVEVLLLVLILVYVLFVWFLVVGLLLWLVVEVFSDIEGVGVLWCDGCCCFEFVFGLWIEVVCL